MALLDILNYLRLTLYVASCIIPAMEKCFIINRSPICIDRIKKISLFGLTEKRIINSCVHLYQVSSI